MKKWALRVAKGFGLLLLLLVVGLATQYTGDVSVELLTPRWAKAPSKFIEVDGMNVHYRDEGEGPVVVLLHGTGASLHTWDDWTRSLLLEGYRVVRMDLPAFGLTGPHPADDYRIAAYVDFVARFADQLGLPPFVLGGNSLGGLIAWSFALDHPARVRALLLVDPAGYPPQGPLPLAFRIGRYPLLAWLGAQLDPRFLVAKTLRQSYGDPTKVSDALLDRYRDMALRSGNRRAFAARTKAPFVDRTGELSNLRVPTLVQWGQLDHVIPVERAYRFSRDIAGAELRIYQRLGHVPMEENPTQTIADVKAFLAKLGKPAAPQ